MNTEKVVVFMDRDGTINVDKDYVYRINDFEFINSSNYAIRKLNKLDAVTVIVTNQSGIERGYYSIEDVEKLHDYMIEELSKMGARIDAIYYCPHLDSEFRKPNPGMFIKAINDLKLSNHRKYVVGDKLSDILAGESVGCKKILVLTGKGKDELKEASSKNIAIDYIAENLFDAVKYIESDIKI